MDIQKFFSKKPRCFGNFDIENSEGVKSDWVSGPEFLSKMIVCPCGNEELNMYSSNEKGQNLAPSIIECPSCGRKEPFFNPEIHGWDGENGESCALIGEVEPKLVNNEPARVVVEYSFQGAENYQELIEDGVENPEDYFDTFAVYLASDSGNLLEVFSYECA